MQPQKREGCFDLSLFEESLTRRERNMLCERCKQPRSVARIKSPYNFPDNPKKMLVCKKCLDEINMMMHQHYTAAIKRIRKPKSKSLWRKTTILILAETAIIASIATLLYKDIALRHITLQNILTSTHTIPYAVLMFILLTTLLVFFTGFFDQSFKQGEWWYEQRVFNMKMRKWVRGRKVY